MNAIEMLRADHEKVKGLFEQFEAAGERAMQKKKGIAEQVFHELEVHTKLEEEIFYPAVKAEGGKEGEEIVAESVEEHHVVDVLMREMRKLEPQDEEWEAKFKVLMENVEHHIEEEHNELFPTAEEALGEQLEALGTRMAERKQELMTAGRAGHR